MFKNSENILITFRASPIEHLEFECLFIAKLISYGQVINSSGVTVIVRQSLLLII